MAGHDRVRIWDIWIRLFHWSLAIGVAFMLISGATGWLFFDWHRLVGEAVLALVFFRILWGLIGSSNARLIQLLTSPRAAGRHLTDLAKRQLHPERGHNAAGGWAVLVMLLLLAIQGITGFFIADEDEFVEGALYGSVSSSSTDLLYRVHNVNAELLQVVVLVHVLMVFVYLFHGRQNLITPMLNGFMKWLPESTPPPGVFFQSTWVGLVSLLLSVSVVGYVAGWFT